MCSCCCLYPEKSTLDIISAIAPIATALASFALAWYIFVYQRRKDNKELASRNHETHRNIRLQWFRETIISPNIKEIYHFFDEMHRLTENFSKKELPFDDKVNLLGVIKKKCYDFRKDFIELIEAVDTNFYQKGLDIIDHLLDTLTANVYDDKIKLYEGNAFNEYIERPINQAKNSLFKTLFSYEGHSR
jgi:hypothetical protein